MPSISGPVTGRDFFDRKKEIRYVMESLEKDNVLLIAPRRYGKTSLMREVERKIRRGGKTCLFLDVMYVCSPEEFMVELADAYFSELNIPRRKRFLDALKGFFNRIGEVEASLDGRMRIKFRDILKEEIREDTWIKSGDDILKAVTASSDKSPVYVFIDELSECVNNIAKNKVMMLPNFSNGSEARDKLHRRSYVFWLGDL